MEKSWRFAFSAGLALISALSAGAIAPSYATPKSAASLIEVTPPPNPTHIPLNVGSVSTAIALGLVVGPGATAGELAGSAQASGRDTKLTESVADRNLRLGDEFAQGFENAFKQKGLDAFSAGATRPPQPPTARLEILIEEMAYERRVWGKIGPKLTVRIRLYDSASGDRLFADTYKYDMYARTIGWTMLRPPEEFGFEEPEDVTAHPDVVVAGFRKGVEMIVEQAVNDIVADLDD